MHAPYRGHRIVAAAAAPPLDTFTTPTGAYSFRALRSAYAGPAIRIRRASDNAETDIYFLGFTSFTGAPIDTAAALAHCAATPCFGTKWYDQSGAARDIVQATAANQPTLVFNCTPAGLPCFQTETNTDLVITAAGVTPTTGIASLSGVAKRTAGNGTCTPIRLNNGIRILTGGVLASWLLQSASVTIHTNAAVPENAWHSALGVIAGAASSIFRIDDVETTNATGGTDVAAGSMGVLGGLTTNCQYVEAVAWNNYVLTAPERAALVNNQRSFWGF